MLIYLIFLPIWNFVLPVYSYWHFDDFSWGATRLIQGENGKSKDDHGSKSGLFDPSKITLRRWEDYERRKRRSMMICTRELIVTMNIHNVRLPFQEVGKIQFDIRYQNITLLFRIIFSAHSMDPYC